jgi:hypothetical protein
MQSTSLLSAMPRLMVEVIVIVVGVLLALWADAFWEERVDRRKELAVLTTIHQEFVENKRRFDLAIDHHKRMFDASVLVLESTPSDCNEDLDAAIELAVINWHTFNPVSGATQSLIASGRLDLIQDEELRIGLASWAGLNLDLAHDEMRTVDLRDKIAEYVAREFPEYFSESQDSICPVLLGDGTFRGLLSLRAAEIYEVTTDNDEIPKFIEKILTATDPATL